MKWEYHTDPLMVSDQAQVERVLNMASEDGWELVTAVPLPSATPGTAVWALAIYKRPKSN